MEGMLIMKDQSFVIVTEDTCDLPVEYIKKHKIECIPLIYTLGDTNFDGIENDFLPPKEFYERLKLKEPAKTSQVPPDGVLKVYEDVITKNKNILHIAFSSGMSGCYQSSTIAITDLREAHPDVNCITIDTKCGSSGQGLLVDYAVKKRAEGLSMEEVAAEIENIKLRVHNYFTLDDLDRLYRSGRISKAVKIVGGVLGIKPIMFLINDGTLHAVAKIRGKKKALDDMVRRLGENIDFSFANYAFISHTDAMEDALYVADQVLKKHKVEVQIIANICATTSCHVGNGTVSLFFFGKERTDKPIS